MKRYTLAVLLALLTAGTAEAASLRICFNNIPLDTTQVRVYYGAVILYDDILVGSDTSDPIKICTTKPIPATLVRGVAQPVTLTGLNAFGEEGPASAAITFRAPTVPTLILGTTIQGVSNP